MFSESILNNYEEKLLFSYYRSFGGVSQRKILTQTCQTIDIRPILCYTRGNLVRQLDLSPYVDTFDKECQYSGYNG
jgi:hypothetical protein